MAKRNALTAGRSIAGQPELASVRPRTVSVSGPFTVVQLLPALDAGGVERATLEISAALVRAGHRAIVVSAGGLSDVTMVRATQPILDYLTAIQEDREVREREREREELSIDRG